MKKNTFPYERENAIATAEALEATASSILETLKYNCTPENVGEILDEVVKASGLAQLLLIDINSLAKAE